MSEHDPDEHGPPGTSFLDLEISELFAHEAEQLSREAARDLLREAIRERLRERLGDRLGALGHLAADALADDIEANLQVESAIEGRRDARASLPDRVREILRGDTRAGGNKRKKKR